MTRLAAVVLVLLAAGFVACDSTEPLTSTASQSVQLSFVVIASSVFEADVWDRYVDSNRNGLVDPGEPRDGYACGESGYFSTFGIGQAPTAFTIDIRVIRSGTVVQEVLTAANAFSSFLSATLEDDRFVTGVTPAQPPSPDFGFAYNNPRRVPDTSYAYLSSCLTDVPLPVFGQVGGLPVPVQISLQQGDTLQVTAGQAPFPLTNYEAVGPLHVDVLVDGALPQSEAIEGITSVGENGTLRFTYQYR